MHSAAAHHLLISAQPLPQQWPQATFPLSSHNEHGAMWSETSLGSLGDSCPSCVPSQLFVPPNLLAGGVRS